METGANASVVESFSVRIRVTAITSAIALPPIAERPAKPPAKHAGSLSQRTRITTAARCTSPGSKRGDCATPDIGAGVDVTAVRYKIS